MSEEGAAVGTSKGNFICPSKSTVYVGNISYSLTNNDLIKIVERCGRVVCAKIAKDKVTRKSKGYAFVQFLQPEAAAKCVQEFEGTEMFGRRWNCSIAIDNGRSAEFVRKRLYPDKSRCYECGEFGHLSYNCPKNALGDRNPPPKRKRKRQHQPAGTSESTGKEKEHEHASTEESNDDGEADKVEADTLSAAINYQRQMVEEQEYREAVATGNYSHLQAAKKETQKRKFVKDGYFSDEERLLEAENADDD